jgi:cytidylate kinase
MAIITISRGSATGGLLLAEGLSKTLNYKIVRREDILQGTARFGVAAAKLEKFLFGPPTFSDDFKHDIRNYLAFFQAALCEYIQKDDVIYLGNVGHMLLRDIACVLSIRLIAPPEFRIEKLVERGKMTREQASAYIDKIDAQRRAWTLLLYGVDWLNPSLYDLTINLESMNIDNAVEIAATAAKNKKLSETDQCFKSIDNMLLSTKIRAELAADSRIAPSEIEVEADAVSATVFLEGKLPSDLFTLAVDIAGNIPGVKRVDTGRLEEIEPLTGIIHE